MAKGKKKRGKASMLTKGINYGILGLAMSRIIHLYLTNDADFATKVLIREASFNMSEGKFDTGSGMRLYGPMAAAIALKKFISYVRRTARV